MTRQEAQELGLLRYTKDQPCKYGHTSERRVKDDRCLECDREWKQKLRAQHPEKVAEYKRKDYQNNKATYVAAQKRRVENNPEKVALEKQQHYQKNKDIYKERAAKWKKENRGRAAYLNAKRKKLIKQATPPWLTSDHWFQIRQYYETADIKIEVDHIVPIQGKTVCGLHVPWNLQHLPQAENSQKRCRVIEGTEINYQAPGWQSS